MCIEELGTIMEQKAPVKMILMNNHYLGNVRQWQDMFWMRRKSFTKFCLPIAEMDYYDLSPTPPVFKHFDLISGDVGQGFVGERFKDI